MFSSGVFFPSDGTCDGFVTRKTCTAIPSQVIAGANMCTWKEEEKVCETTEPPASVLFLVIIAFMILLFAKPFEFFGDFVAEEILTHRPTFQKWFKEQFNIKFHMDSWFGSVYHKSEVDKSALAIAFQFVADTRLKEAIHPGTEDRTGDGVRDEEDEEAELMEMGEMERDVVAYKIFDDFVTPEEELRRLLDRVQRSMNDRYLESSVPVWRRTFFDATDSKQHVESLRAIHKQLKINPDGSLAPLTITEWLRYGSRQNMLVKRIERARREAAAVLAEVNEVEVPDESMKDIVLIRQFILSRVNFMIRFALRLSFEELEGLPPEPVHPLLWVAGWLAFSGMIAFFCYWTFAWGIKNTGKNLTTWGTDYGIAVIQDMFVIEIIKLLIMVVWALATVRPQLHMVRRVINEKAIAIAQDEGDPDNDIHVVQHFCPACRAARSETLSDLAASVILRRFTDADLAKCQTHRYYFLGILVFVILLALTVLVVLGEKAMDNIVEVGVLIFWSGFIAANSVIFLLPAGPFLIVMIYSLSVSIAMYWIFSFRPSVRHYRRYARSLLQSRHLPRTRYGTRDVPAELRGLPWWHYESIRMWQVVTRRVGNFVGEMHVVLSPYERWRMSRDKRVMTDAVWMKMNKTRMMNVRVPSRPCVGALVLIPTSLLLLLFLLRARSTRTPTSTTTCGTAGTTAACQTS